MQRTRRHATIGVQHNETDHCFASVPCKQSRDSPAPQNFSDILIFNEDRKKVDGVMHIHLPDGPTARYRLISLKLSKDIANCGRSTEHRVSGAGASRNLVVQYLSCELGHDGYDALLHRLEPLAWPERMTNAYTLAAVA